tara:strand:+ start:13879 stop:14937 length:1059 start_codon:yes stop_codon:yes gene_type:complete
MKRIAGHKKIIGVVCVAIGSVILLFLLSEKEVHRNNAFTRRFPPHPIFKKRDFELGHNSYYIAGLDRDILYLGNPTTPLFLLKINLSSKDTAQIKIDIKESNLPFRNIKFRLYPPYFFMLDGTVPCIFRGRINEWIARPWSLDSVFFDVAIPVDSQRLIIRSFDGNSHSTILGIMDKDTSTSVSLKHGILEKQIDGVFDVDGILTYSTEPNLLSYVYYYRNEYIIMDSDLTVLKRQQTLDTVHKAHLQVAPSKQGAVTEMLAPPLIVNNNSSLDGELIYTNSNRLGKYEDNNMLDQASIIDVYNWKNDIYGYSFYLYKERSEHVNEIKVSNNTLYVLVGNRLSTYEIRNSDN